MEIVQTVFDAFARGDTDALLELCDEDIAITQPRDLPGIPSEQHGHSGVLEALAIWPAQWEDYRTEVVRVVADRGNLVVVTARSRGRGKQSGIDVEMDFTFVFTVSNGKIVEWRLFMREDQALEAAGLAE